MQVKTILKNMYFVKHGDRTGQFLIFLDYDADKKIYSALGLPESEPVYISDNDVQKAITHKVLEHVELLPEDVYEQCRSEFNYRQNNK